MCNKNVNALKFRIAYRRNNCIPVPDIQESVSSELECRLTETEAEGAGGVAEVAEEGVVSVKVRSASSPGETEHRDTSGGLNTYYQNT